MAVLKWLVHLLENLGQPEACSLGESCEGQLYALGSGHLFKMTSVFWAYVLMTSDRESSICSPEDEDFRCCCLKSPPGTNSPSWIFLLLTSQFVMKTGQVCLWGCADSWQMIQVADSTSFSIPPLAGQLEPWERMTALPWGSNEGKQMQLPLAQWGSAECSMH
jgi:hypothetical protein